MDESDLQAEAMEAVEAARRLARECAELLGDREGYPFYLKIAQQYPETYVRKILNHVLALPPERIRTSRGALFNWLIEHHGKIPHNGESTQDDRA
jgi:hypothetical protein